MTVAEKVIKQLMEVAPPGMEGTVKELKKDKSVTNPWALAWWMKHRGYRSHKTKSGKDK